MSLTPAGPPPEVGPGPAASPPVPPPGQGFLAGFQMQVTTPVLPGMLPDPEVVRRWNDLRPGAADVILQQWTTQTAHRQALEKSSQFHAHRRSYLGLLAGLIVTLAFALTSVYAFSQGLQGGGAAVGTVDVAALAAVFVIGRRNGGQTPPPAPPTAT